MDELTAKEIGLLRTLPIKPRAVAANSPEGKRLRRAGLAINRNYPAYQLERTAAGDALLATLDAQRAVDLTADEIGIVELIISTTPPRQAGAAREAFESARRKLQQANGVID
jgi:hypothetical protein